MRRVIVESPFAGNVLRNIGYARSCLRDCLKRGDAPIASHLLYTQPDVLDDTNPAERELGMSAGWAWITVADAMLVYTDYGISPGMERGIAEATRLGITIEYHSLYPNTLTTKVPDGR